MLLSVLGELVAFALSIFVLYHVLDVLFHHMQ